MCKLIDKIITDDYKSNILVMSHDKRILEQNHSALNNFFEFCDIGLYSSGLNSRTVEKITVAGIQSVYKKDYFDIFNYIIIDECHSVNNKDQGMYRKFLKKIKAVCIGLTATPYRTGQGYIYKSKDSIFNHVSYDMSSPEIFNRLIDEGYLCPLFAYSTALKLDTADLKTIAGDYSQKQMSEKFDRIEITTAAVVEACYYGKNYKKWLCFAIDIEHCENIVKILNENGISSVAIHSKLKDIDERVKKYINGEYRCAVNVNMLTTGFDDPEIDLIFDLRPTKSEIIHVQGKGRGLRPVYSATPYGKTTVERKQLMNDGPKPHCLVLDYAGNTQRLGPINYIQIQDKTKSKKGKGEGVTKICTDCNFINWGGAKECINCGFEFKFKEKLELKASTCDIIKQSKPFIEKKWIDIDKAVYSILDKKPKIFKVVYYCGLLKFSEVVYLDYKGKTKYNALHWVNCRWPRDIKLPQTVDELYSKKSRLRIPRQILIDPNHKYPKILNYQF